MAAQALVWIAALLTTAAPLVPEGVLSTGTSTGLPNANDAGTGGDAGDSPEAATRLEAYGTYAGMLNSKKDADWYGWRPASSSDTPLCIAATVTGDALSHVSLVAQSANGDSRTVKASTGNESLSSTAAVAFPASASTFLGFVPVENPAGGDPTRPGSYAFDIRALRASDITANDAGLPGDAGMNIGSARPVGAGCFGGVLAAADQRDVFSFQGQTGQVVTVSMHDVVASGARMSLLGPSGSRIATVPSNGVFVATLTESGTYYLSMERSTAIPLAGDAPPIEAPYTFGLGLDPDPGQGCRPGC